MDPTLVTKMYGGQTHVKELMGNKSSSWKGEASLRLIPALRTALRAGFAVAQVRQVVVSHSTRRFTQPDLH